MNIGLVCLTFNELVLKVPLLHVKVLFVYSPLGKGQSCVLGAVAGATVSATTIKSLVQGEGVVRRVAVTRGEGNGG